MLPGDRISSVRIERVEPMSQRLADERAAGVASYLQLKKQMASKKRRKKVETLDETEAKPDVDTDRTEGEEEAPADRVEGQDAEEALDQDIEAAPDYLAPEEEEPPLIETERVEFEADEEEDEEAEDPDE